MRLSEGELARLLAQNPDLQSQERAGRSKGEAPAGARRSQSEHTMQVAVMAACAERASLVAEYGLIYAVPNGGQRRRGVAGKLKAEGVRRGMLDLVVPVARHGYHGAYIELKTGRNRLTAEQRQWLILLDAQGYFVAVVYDLAGRVMELLHWYLEESEAGEIRR